MGFAKANLRISFERRNNIMSKQYETIIQKMKKNNNWCLFNEDKKPFNNSGTSYGTLLSQYTYEEAEQFRQKRGFPYLGVIINKGLCCIDIDNCISEDGQFCQLAIDVMERFKPNYIEYSISKRGIHIYFYVTSKELKQLKIKENTYRTTVELYDGEKISLEFYYKPCKKAIIFSENAIDKEKEFYPSYVSFTDLISFLDKYMKKDDAGKNTDKSPSGEDFNRMCNCVTYANGNKDLSKELFFQSNPKNRRGPYTEKWNREDYISDTFKKAKKKTIEELNKTYKAMPKCKDARYLYFGERFFRSMKKDRQEFVRSKNYLYSFLRILWEANKQYSNKTKFTRQNHGKYPCIRVHHDDIAEVIDCSSYKKAMSILCKLEQLGYLQYKGVPYLDITIEKFYEKDQKGNYKFKKDYVCMEKSIFEDYFLKAKLRCEKSDLLLYLYCISEYCSYEEYRKTIRCVFTAAFGYRYDNEYINRQKRYDISEKSLASFLNIRPNTLCDQLKSLQKLRYIFISENGSKYDRGIFITLCNFDAYYFTKYSEKGEKIHEKAHQELRECLKIRNRFVNEKSKITEDNFLNREEPLKEISEYYDCAA